MTWTWPDDLIAIAIVLAVALVTRFLAVRTIRGLTARALTKARQRREGTSTRADQILAAATFANGERYEQRTATMGSLLTSLTTATVFVIAVLTILAIVDVPLAPLLTSAGVGGVALAFGAQSLVKDFISGIFMILEDQYGVGDFIDVGEITGTVEEVGLRVTRLRDATGQVWYVRNGEITRVGNLSQGWSTAIADVPIAPDEDPVKAIAVLEQVATDLEADPSYADLLLDRPTVVVVNAVTPTSILIRVTARTAPNRHWPVQRTLLERSVGALTAAGVHAAVVVPYIREG
ncbi:MAG TPA: mechanosensitive ion channel family protein [Propionicimonas sp.]|nr:mechanosensitive ion channel family protein [Propionicimonas sp.]